MRHPWTITGALCLLATTLHAGPKPQSQDQGFIGDTPRTGVQSNPVYQGTGTSGSNPVYQGTGTSGSNPIYKATETSKITSSIPAVAVSDVRLLDSIRSSKLIAASELHPVHEYDETLQTNPQGISLIRGGNHRIERSQWGGQNHLLRAVGSPDGAVFVWYTTRNQQGGPEPHIRKILPDNQIGFDKTLLLEELAGIAPDGNGGVIVATHHASASGDNSWQMDQTRHTTLRLGPTGDTVWQREEAIAGNPSGNSQHWSTVTRSDQGFFLGYGVKFGADQVTPVLIHRKKADGVKLYKRVGLKAPSGSEGGVGSADLRGIVDRVWLAGDGSAIASVFDGGGDPIFVRLNAAGVQTAAFACPGALPELIAHNAGTVACVHMPPAGTITVNHYGVQSGDLTRLGAWTSAAVSGWDFTHVLVTPDGQYLAAATTTSGYAGVALFSAAGVLLVKTLVEARKGEVKQLHLGPNAWLALHRGADQRLSQIRGTFNPGN